MISHVTKSPGILTIFPPINKEFPFTLLYSAVVCLTISLYQLLFASENTNLALPDPIPFPKHAHPVFTTPLNPNDTAPPNNQTGLRLCINSSPLFG